MSSTIRWDVANTHQLGTSKSTISTATTNTFDFGTPDDLPLHQLTTFHHGDRILIALTASTAGTTGALTWAIYDADDSSGAIGTPAAAEIHVIAGALAAGTGDDFSLFAMKIKSGRPWIRITVTSTGTDTHVCHCQVIGIASNA